MDLKPPCASKEAIFLDFRNLSSFLDYLELSQKRSFLDIADLKRTVSILPDILKDIKEIKNDQELHRKMIDSNERSIGNVSHRVFSIEENEKLFKENIRKVEEKISLINENLTSNNEKIRNLNIVTENNSKNIEKIHETIHTMKADIESNTNLITILHSDTKVNKDKIVFVEGELNEFKEKAVTKIKKNKVKFNDQLKKHSNRLNEIDNNIKGLYAMMLKVNKQVTVLEENKKRMDLENGVNNDLDRIESSNLFTQNENPFQLNFSNNQLEEFKEEFNKNLDKLVNTTKVQGDELDRIKKYLSAQKRTTDDDSSTSNTKQETRVLEYKIENEVKKEDLDEVKKIIKMFSDNETTLRDSISEKIKKEEIEMITKSFNVEIDKISHKLNKLIKDLEIKEEEVPEVKTVENAVNLVGGVEEIRRVMVETVKSHEVILRFEYKSNQLEADIAKIYESIIDLRKKYTEELTEKKKENLDIFIDRMNELEFDIKQIKQLTDELKSENHFENEDMHKKANKSETEKFFLTNQSSNPNGTLSLKEFVRVLGVSVKMNSEKLDKVNHRIDLLIADILERLKKDLSNESMKILDNFKIELKYSISRIEEQMREKVDRFNMEEFSKKIEHKMFSEMSKKLDRMDLKKNNTIINKKIDNLENKISKTLVDTLIDLQFEDTPLIVRKGLQGPEKCGSCNQNVPMNIQNNGMNPLNEMNTSIELKKIKKPKERTLAASSSTVIQLPEINNKGTNTNNNPVKSPEKSKKEKMKKTEKVDKNEGTSRPLNQSRSMKHFDENSEKQLTNLINEELEKVVVKPNNIIKVSKKVFENIEKKMN